MYNEVYGYDKIIINHDATLKIPIKSPDSRDLSEFSITFRVEKISNSCEVMPLIPVLNGMIKVPVEIINELLGEYYITILFSDNSGEKLVDKSILSVRR